jgi:predicted nucleotidyltransferase
MAHLKFDLSRFAAYFEKQPDILVAYLFGSMARGEANERSDVDIAVLLPAEFDSEAILSRRLEILNAIGDFVDREVQVTALNQVSPFFAYQVVKEGHVVYEKDKASRVEFEVRAMKRYFDFKPILEYQNRALIRSIKEAGLGRSERGAARTLEAAERIQAGLDRISKS